MGTAPYKSKSKRRKASKALDSLGRESNSKVVRYVHGVALVHAGKTQLGTLEIGRSKIGGDKNGFTHAGVDELGAAEVGITLVRGLPDLFAPHQVI